MESELREGESSFASGPGALLERAGVSKTSVIQVVGEGGLQAVLWLCRHGYERAGFLHGVGPAEPADVVLAPCAGDVAALDDALTQAAHLPSGGLMLVRARPSMGGETTAERLARSGFRIERRLPGARRDLYLARRCGRAGALAPAIAAAA
jgi:hypothetical protein